MANFGELVLVLGDLHIPQRASKIPTAFKRMLVPNKMQHVICTGNLSAENYMELQSLAPNVHVVAGDYDAIATAGTEIPQQQPQQPQQHSSQPHSSPFYHTNNAPQITSPPSSPSLSPRMFPETLVVQVGAFRVGVIHGHQILPWNSKEALERTRRKLNVDILVTGHSHQNEVSVLHTTSSNDNNEELPHYHINPGSITGAPSALVVGEVIPSFILLAVQDTKVVCYVYELVQGEVQVSKTEFNKRVPSTRGSGSVAGVEAANAALMASLLS